MPATVKELSEKRLKVWEQAKKLNDGVSGRKFTAEEEGTWKKLNDELDSIGGEIERAKRLEEIGGEFDELPGGASPGGEDLGDERDEDEEDDGVSLRRAARRSFLDQAIAIRGWLKSTSRADLLVTDEEKAAAKRAKIPLGKGEVEIRLPSSADVNRMRIASARELRDQSNENPTLGGYLRPEGFVPRIERALLAFGPMRQVAELLRTDTGNQLPWPSSNDTSNEGAQIGENTAAATVDIAVGAFLLGAYKYSSKFVKVPRELLEDAGVDIAGYIADSLGERLSRIQNRHATTGDGAGKPKGIVNASVLGKTAAGATAILPDEIIDLAHSVDPAYRAMPSCAYMMHDNILAAIRKLKDSQNHYLWTPTGQGGITQGPGGTLYDFPVRVNQHMQSSIATGTRTVIFGNLAAYKIREVRSVVLKRLVERFADQDQEGFIAFLRFDSGLLDAGTNPVKHLVQA